MNRTVILLSFLFMAASLSAQDKTERDVFVPITKYIANGDAESLSVWFGDNLELDVLGNVNNCSRSQAKQILKNFFVNYTPQSFEIVHKSASYPMKYAVGLLDGGGSRFKITLFVKTAAAGNYIQQVTIEKD